MRLTKLNRSGEMYSPNDERFRQKLSPGARREREIQIWENVLTNATKRNSAQALSTKIRVQEEREIVFFRCKKRDREIVFFGCRKRDRVYLLTLEKDNTPEEDNFCRKRLCTIVSLSFVTLVSTFPQITSSSSFFFFFLNKGSPFS